MTFTRLAFQADNSVIDEVHIQRRGRVPGEVLLGAFWFIYHLLPKQGSCWGDGFRQPGGPPQFFQVCGRERPGVCHRVKVEKNYKRGASLHHRMPGYILWFFDPVWFPITSSCNLLLNRPSLCFRNNSLGLDNIDQVPESSAVGVHPACVSCWLTWSLLTDTWCLL